MFKEENLNLLLWVIVLIAVILYLAATLYEAYAKKTGEVPAQTAEEIEAQAEIALSNTP